MSQEKVVLDEDDVRRTLVRIAHEIVEKNPDGAVALVGIHRRGAHLATRLHRLVSDLLETDVPAGDIDIAFYRDDLATREAPVVHSSHLPFRLEDHTIVLVDDVLFTGRTVRAGIDALFDYGRPARVQLAVLADRAASFTEVSEREVKKVPALRGRRVLNLFYEASTRTRSSFELAAKTLSAEVINFVSSGSSVEKGESLKDTVQTLSAYRPDLIVVRTPHVGAADLVARWSPAAVVNAGDGKHEHPTQALLDVYTLRERLGALDGANIWIVGDVLHSRVARSNILAFTKLGARVTVCGPPTLIPRGIESLGCEVSYTLDDLGEADVVYALRMQRERMTDSYVPSLREYASRYQVDGRRLGPRQVLMHPGPVNRGVELAAEVIDSPQALIGQQVAAGVVVRMAVLYECLAGRDAPVTTTL